MGKRTTQDNVQTWLSGHGSEFMWEKGSLSVAGLESPLNLPPSYTSQTDEKACMRELSCAGEHVELMWRFSPYESKINDFSIYANLFNDQTINQPEEVNPIKGPKPTIVIFSTNVYILSLLLT